MSVSGIRRAGNSFNRLRSLRHRIIPEGVAGLPLLQSFLFESVEFMISGIDEEPISLRVGHGDLAETPSTMDLVDDSGAQVLKSFHLTGKRSHIGGETPLMAQAATAASKGDGVHHAMLGIARLHNLTPAG